MSMHKTPLTTIEESGLRAHGLDIGTPSQLSDAFRQGVAWAQKAPPEKRAPVQGWPDGIPWSLHMEAYAAYSKKWAPQAALIDLEGRNCRGGFSTGELDDFIPGWKDKVSEIHKLRTEINRLQAALHRAMQAKTAAASAPDGYKTFQFGDSVKKVRGSQWTGKVVGTYSTAMTPEGYAVESSTEIGSVQIYPAAALELTEAAQEPAK